MTMKLSPTPLLLALLPLLVHASPGDDHTETADSKITKLATVEVTADAKDAARDAGSNAWGKASLHDTPASIQRIDRDQIEARRIRTLSELAREDAALGDNYAPVGYYQNIAIRGYPLDLATGYRGNGLLITGEQILALEDKQQVEVLKGLAGLSAGVIEPGGTVNFISKRPADVRTLTFGTDARGSRYAALDIGSWLTPTFGLRANLAWDAANSYVEHSKGRRNLFALAADWKLSDATTLELDANHQSSAQRSASGYMLLGGSQLPAHPEPEKLLGYQPWQQPVRIHAYNASARLHHAFSDDWQLQLSAGRSHSVIDDNVAFAYGCYYTVACASGNVPGNFFAPDGDYDVYDYRSPDDTRVSDQARAVLTGQFGAGEVQHELSLGVSAFHRGITRRPYVYDYVGTANINDPTPPVFAPSPNQPGNPVRRFDSWQRTAFALDRVHLGAQWQVLVGANAVRMHERAWKKSGKLIRSTRIEKTLPQLALLWQPSAALTTYFSASEGISLGKEAPFWTSNDGEFLAPRLSRQLEAGIKYRWHDALDLSAAVFRIRQPFQFAQPDTSNAGYTFVQSGDEVHSGLELSASGRVREKLGVNASVALIRARAQGTGTPAFEGHQVANVPSLRSSLQLDYRLLPQLDLQAGWRHVSSNPATPTGQVRAAAYEVFNAGLRWHGQWRGMPLNTQLGVDNLFNHRYWRDTGSSDGDSYLFPGAPRTVWLTVQVSP
ncbi:MAG: TonB-dependent siderophore receptor [Xanthomonadaceae bacterium]|nr:TonB-dependent siderophore receptor [Xanthomonadaceae bacterium]